jgi:diadenosine tetraphosphate (Ap4A) HIT family hydrolase
MAETWMPREQWDALVRGEGCELCEVVATRPPINDYGITVAGWETSVLRLMRNQYVPGYCVLICTQHIREPYELTPQMRGLFFEDMMRAGIALEKAYQPLKMNFQILGNLTPHLHAHLIPRYYGDDGPHAPLDPWRERKLLSDEDLLKQVEALRAALE